MKIEKGTGIVGEYAEREAAKTQQPMMVDLDSGIVATSSGLYKPEINDQPNPSNSTGLEPTKEQPVGCSERIEHPFDEIWKGLETIQHKLHDKYHFDLAAIKKVAADTHALCRPYWDEFHCNLPKRESGEVLSMLKKYRVAASRMCDRWAEGDQAVKNELWKALHGLESDALEMIERAERAPS